MSASLAEMGRDGHADFFPQLLLERSLTINDPGMADAVAFKGLM